MDVMDEDGFVDLYENVYNIVVYYVEKFPDNASKKFMNKISLVNWKRVREYKYTKAFSNIITNFQQTASVIYILNEISFQLNLHSVAEKCALLSQYAKYINLLPKTEKFRYMGTSL